MLVIYPRAVTRVDGHLEVSRAVVAGDVPLATLVHDEPDLDRSTTIAFEADGPLLVIREPLRDSIIVLPGGELVNLDTKVGNEAV